MAAGLRRSSILAALACYVLYGSSTHSSMQQTRAAVVRSWAQPAICKTFDAATARRKSRDLAAKPVLFCAIRNDPADFNAERRLRIPSSETTRVASK